MRNIYLLIILTTFTLNCFGQRNKAGQNFKCDAISNYSSNAANNLNKTTAIGSTTTLSNIPSADTLYIYHVGSGDSGYLTGTNSYGDIGFAERFEFNGYDSSVSIIGVLAQFSGKVNPASNRTINFNVWHASAPVLVTATLAYTGFPSDIIDTLTVPVTSLGIGHTVDTMKAFLFSMPTGPLYYSFFVGYSINYDFGSLNGDTLGLCSTKNGVRISHSSIPEVHINDIDTTYDTLINVQNATQWSDKVWYDNYSQNDSLLNDLAIYPIVTIGGQTSVGSITRNGLTLYNAFPNPAKNETNIKFSLANTANVTIQVLDMSGKTVKVSCMSVNYPQGEHVVPISLDGIANGDYLYLITTSNGAGVAGKFGVGK